MQPLKLNYLYKCSIYVLNGFYYFQASLLREVLQKDALQIRIQQIEGMQRFSCKLVKFISSKKENQLTTLKPIQTPCFNLIRNIQKLIKNHKLHFLCLILMQKKELILKII